MTKYILLFFVAFSFSPLMAQTEKVKTIKFQELQNQLDKLQDTILVVNFWATWCGPCIKELPHFKAATEQLQGKKVRFVYISLDFENRKPRVEEILAKNGLNGTFYLLQGDANEWINKVDPAWQGDIPYTFIAKKGGEKIPAAKAFESTQQLVDFITKAL